MMQRIVQIFSRFCALNVLFTLDAIRTLKEFKMQAINLNGNFMRKFMIIKTNYLVIVVSACKFKRFD